MTTTAHPMQLAGPARTRWCAATAVRVGLNLAALAGFAWLVTRRPLPLVLNDAQLALVAAVLIAGHALNRWLMWLAWAEVPGAYGRNRRAEPLPDRLVTIALNLAVIPTSVWLAAQHPTDEGLALIALVGTLGSILFAARLAMRLVRREAPSRIAAASSGLVAAVALSLASNAASLHAVRTVAIGMAVIYAIALATIHLSRRHQ